MAVTLAPIEVAQARELPAGYTIQRGRPDQAPVGRYFRAHELFLGGRHGARGGALQPRGARLGEIGIRRPRPSKSHDCGAG